MKWIATALFGAVAVLYAAATALEHHGPAWAYVAAFAEAAMVGAIADWFAVTALFRHPLGLSFIPHTAIIPRNKHRIADNLGGFVQGEFFAPERITAVIRELDPAGRLAVWLATPDNAQAVAAAVKQSLSYALNALDEKEVRAFLDRNLAGLFNEVDLSDLSGQILQALTREGRHQAVLDQLLGKLDELLHQPEIKQVLVTQLATKVPLYFDKVKASVAASIIERILESLGELIAAVDGDPEHPLRRDFDAAVERYAVRLRSDPLLQQTIKRFQSQLAGNEQLRTYVQGLWHDLKAWIAQDLASPQSHVQARIAQMIEHLGDTLRADPAMQRWLTDELLARLPAMLDRLRPRIGALIAEKVREWKDEEVVDKLELNIGRDLQYIRINGTVVGGLVGLLIHIVTVALR